MARKRIADQTKGIGKPKVGGPFQLVDQDGKTFTSDEMLGKYSLVREHTFLFWREELRLTRYLIGLLWLHALP